MRILYAASEVTGFAKTGGLADVAASLPRTLAQHGLDVAVILPLYRCIRTGSVPLQPTPHTFSVAFQDQHVTGRLWRSLLPGSNVTAYLVEQPDFFERDDVNTVDRGTWTVDRSTDSPRSPVPGSRTTVHGPRSPVHGPPRSPVPGPRTRYGLYQYTRDDGVAFDYADNSRRFAFFCRAILEAVGLLESPPDVVHINDWQTGLVPVYLREIYRRVERRTLRHRYEQLRVLCTIHNIAYQGLFDHCDLPTLELPWRLYTYEYLEFHGYLNFLKAGLVFADLLNTVSPMYAREIQTPYFGCGLQGVLLQRARQLSGIVNGVDYAVWDPAHDSFLPARYDVDNVTAGKSLCKAHLQQASGLTVDPAAPLLGIVSRLAEQKGIELVVQAAPQLLRAGAQLIVLGQGDITYQHMLARLREAFPGRVALHFEQNERLAHQIEAGADIFLMPSQYEPCGLNQLYSLKYGTVPVVRATGGLADTVADASARNLQEGKATGFVFIPPAAREFQEAVERALAMYRQQPAAWLALQQTGMRQDWSWHRSAEEYTRLYQRLKTES